MKSVVRRRVRVVLTTAIVTLGTFSAGATPPAQTISDVMARVGQYVQTYAEQMAFVIGVEHYRQGRGATRTNTDVARTLASEFVLVRVGDEWLGFRDVFEVDGKPVADRQDRLRRLFLEHPDTAVVQSRRVADEGARYNVGSVTRNFNTPTFALYFLQPDIQPRFRFKKSGDEQVDGVAAWKIDFREVKKPTIIRTSAGKDMPVSGSLLIDPQDGRVLRSFMEIVTVAKITAQDPKMEMGTQPSSSRQADLTARSVTSSARVTVTYRPDEKLGLLIPAEMRESYVGPLLWTGSKEIGPVEVMSRVDCVAAYSDFKRFETSGRVVVPK